VNADYKVDGPFVNQVDLVVATEKAEVVKPIPIEQPTSPPNPSATPEDPSLQGSCALSFSILY
jgi:hypothetical protein